MLDCRPFELVSVCDEELLLLLFEVSEDALDVVSLVFVPEVVVFDVELVFEVAVVVLLLFEVCFDVLLVVLVDELVPDVFELVVALESCLN